MICRHSSVCCIYIYILHTEELLAAPLHSGNENVKQLFYTIVCFLLMGQWGPKYLGVGVFCYDSINIVLPSSALSSK